MAHHGGNIKGEKDQGREGTQNRVLKEWTHTRRELKGDKNQEGFT
jgi:hypothetical protein